MVLLELIVSLLLFSILAITSSKMVFSLVKENKNSTFIVQNNLVLETTRLFLTKHNDFTKYTLLDTNLYFEENLLLENISRFETEELNNIKTINICIYKDTLCQIWKIKI
jgi:type II secretory pathway component PulJ